MLCDIKTLVTKRHIVEQMTEKGPPQFLSMSAGWCQRMNPGSVEELLSAEQQDKREWAETVAPPADHEASQHVCIQANLKQILPAVHGPLSPHCCSSTCFTLPTMPTLPEDKGQAKEAQHNSFIPAKDTTIEGTTCNTPSTVLPENAVTPDVEIDKYLVNRPCSPHRRHSNRATRNSTSSLTSVDNRGHVIDLVNDLLPDVKISEEDKKNLELLEEAKKVSERFLTRRGRKSRSSLQESPTGSDACTTTSIESVSPGQNNRTVKEDDRQTAENAAKGLIDRRQNDQRKISQGGLAPRSAVFENSKEKLSDQKENFDPHKHMDTLPKCSPSSGDGGRMSLNTCMNVCENELGKSFLKKGKENDVPLRSHLSGPGIGNMDSKLKIPVPEMRDHKVPCKPEFKLCGLHPPLLWAVSWDSLEPGHKEKIPLKFASEEEKSFFGNKSSNQLKTFKDLQIQVQPVRMQKLTKLREEHILMRNQNLVGLKLPELSKAVEQENGTVS
ncbi:inositol 1,4,5-triphosphate receptor associated 1-like [Malurus melanocephalus]|uniref:inositol 1,4,5-triphosphate receptor associated 1-like n=1 Tax=Malurus melanocephalus TaxID=175006 RepID=UPI0025485210|nr:inositol 1,4,5-triphosphate receptor associated 1-like [Malurus melanocephalus]